MATNANTSDIETVDTRTSNGTPPRHPDAGAHVKKEESPEPPALDTAEREIADLRQKLLDAQQEITRLKAEALRAHERGYSEGREDEHRHRERMAQLMATVTVRPR